MSNWDISNYSVKHPVRLLLHKRQRLLIVHVGQCLAWWRWFALLKVDCHRDWMELFHNPYPYHPCTVNRPLYIYIYYIYIHTLCYTLYTCGWFQGQVQATIRYHSFVLDLDKVTMVVDHPASQVPTFWGSNTHMSAQTHTHIYIYSTT